MMMHEDTRKELSRLVALVDARRAAFPPFVYETRHNYDEAVQALVNELEQEGGRFGVTSGNHTIMLAGIRASSTISVDSALQNWRAGARKRLGGAS